MILAISATAENSGKYSDEYGIEYDYGYDDGYDAGCDHGYEVGYEDGRINGYDEGYDDAYDEAYNDGYKARIKEAATEMEKETEFLLYLTIAIIIIIYFVDKFKKFNIEKEKKLYVSRIIHGDWQIDHYHIDYDFYYFEMVQRELKLADTYKLTKDDKEQVTKIFAAFKNDLSEKYFSDRIGLPKSKLRINFDTFLMYYLYLFLDKGYCSSFFCEEPMHKETITHKSYPDDGYDATYSVTEFAVVVFKLLYISYMYCKNSTVLNPNGKIFNNEKHVEELIDTKTISIMCYRP